LNYKKIKTLLTFPNTFQVFTIFFISLLLLIGFWRFIFLINQIQNTQLENLILYIQSFWIGLRLDAVVVSYLSIPVIIFLPLIIIKSKYFYKIFYFYSTIVFFLYSLIIIIDIQFFNELGTHLNILALQSNAFSREVWIYAWKEYPVIYVLLGVGMIVFIWYKIINFFKPNNNKSAIPLINRVFFFVISLLLFGTCIRGGWQERPIDWGHAMFSKNQLANQVALNPIFNFVRSILQLNSEKNISELLQFMDDDKAVNISRDLILSPQEMYLDTISLKRKIIDPTTIKPHIILIILESFLGSNCGFINEKYLNVTPNLNKIANNGINCLRAFASGKRSAYGLSSILCSWPVLPGFPLISQLESQKGIETIGTLLKKINYSTSFIYGGDADFDNMKGFVISNGFDKVIEQSDFPINTPGTMWGVFDEYIFDYAENILDTSQTPSLITIFTTTNHQPWIIPENKKNILPDFSHINEKNYQVFNTMAYTDYVIGEFIDKNREKKWFDNTIFVFVSDHGINEYNGMYEDPRNAHIPLIFYSPYIIKKPKIINTVTSQVDIIPSLLNLIGYPLSFELMGKNILIDNNKGIACRIVNDYATWFEYDLLYTEIFNQKNNLIHYSNLYMLPYIDVSNRKKLLQSVQNNFHAYIQTAYNYFKNR